MTRKACRAAATTEQMLTSLRTQCVGCDQPMWVAYHTQRTITTLQGNCCLTLCVRRCRNPQCEWYHRPYRPEEEGRWALPHGEFGLDVIALIGTLRYTAHRSIPEIHQALRDRGVSIAERTVTHLLQRYEESIALYKRLHNQREYANMLNSISEVYKLQGKLDEALLRCKIALRIYNDLFRTGNASEFSIGLTLSTMGQIYLDMDTISNAEEAFQQAYEIYHRTNGKRSIANTLNRFGQIAIARSNWQEAKQWFEQAQEASAGIDSEVYIHSLNQQGHLLAKQGNWIEAVAFFEQAVNLARQIHDDLQYTENLVDLAEAFEYTHQRQKALQLLQEAEQISLKWNYFHLLGRAAEFQGDVDYNAGHYGDAFIHYGEYCYYMARRNEHEYGKALHKLTDQIVGVPKNEIHPIIDSLVTYWYKQKMDEEYPDFVNACKDADVLP